MTQGIKAKLWLCLAGLVLALPVLISGCGASPEQLGNEVRVSMQSSFDKEAQFKAWGLRVVHVQVIHDQGNHYKGIATIAHQGESHQVAVSITSDGSNMMWEVQPGAFMFVAQKEMQRLQGLFQN